MGIVYDVGLSFVFLSESIIQYPNLRSDFEELYKTDKYRFYERARHHRYYDHINMVDNTLEAEVAMRRVFGILLCAEDDEFIRRFVQIKLMGTDARYEKIIENPNKKDITRFWEQNQRVKAESYAQRNSPFWFLAYLLYSSFGINNNETVDWYLAMNQEDLSEMNRYSLEGYISNYRNFDDDFIVTLRGVRNIIRRLNAGLDICSFTDFLENSLLRVNSVNANPELYRFIEDYYKSGKDEAQDIDSAIFTELLASGVMSVNGMSLSGLLREVRVTEDEHKLLLKILASANHKANKDFRHKRQSTYSPKIAEYLVGILFLLMAKEIRSMKDFYFRNNDETQYLEIQRLENVIDEKDGEIERLKAELTKANEFNEQQHHEIKQLTEAVYKENRDAIKPFSSEISALNSRIRNLEKERMAEQAKAPELNALREFVFSLKYEYIPQSTTITLEKLMVGKKIIILGGHANWRNKMKERFPAITFLDGHSVSFDNALFDNADITLFYAANMSHKVYYKVIDYLRERKLRFDYLGRSTNQSLLEAEIASVLQDKF